MGGGASSWSVDRAGGGTVAEVDNNDDDVVVVCVSIQGIPVKVAVVLVVTCFQRGCGGSTGRVR